MNRLGVATTEAPAKAPRESLSEQQGAGSRLSPEASSAIYKDMFLGREFEEMCAQMYYRGKMFGFVHLYSGQEVRPVCSQKLLVCCLA